MRAAGGRPRMHEIIPPERLEFLVYQDHRRQVRVLGLSVASSQAPAIGGANGTAAPRADEPHSWGFSRKVCGALLTGIASLLLCGLCTAAPAFKSAPMPNCSGLPCVDATTNAGHMKLMIDTGNSRSILDSAVATRLGLELTPYVGRDGKPRPNVKSATLKDLRIGDVSLGDVKVAVVDLQSSIQKGEIPAADGLLAYPAFAGRVLRMDYAKRRIEVSDATGQELPCPKDCGSLTTPTFGHDGPPIVATTGFSVNGKPITVQIDTLYSGSMLIYPTSVEALGLQEQAKSSKMRMFPYTDGGVNMIESEARAENFGTMTLKRQATLYFATAEVHLPDALFDGTVGNELFLEHVLTFDFHSNRFWIS
jgi:hypothetical protein